MTKPAKPLHNRDRVRHKRRERRKENAKLPRFYTLEDDGLD